MNSGREYTPESFRISLEARLKQMAATENVDLQRLRRQVAFDRLLCRIFYQKSSPWILKGGYAMELRLTMARTTRDIDLAFRRTGAGATDEDQRLLMLELLQEAAALDLGDRFVFAVGEPIADLDGAPYGGSRYPVESRMSGRLFVRFHLDAGMGDIVVEPLEKVESRDWLQFAGILPGVFTVMNREQIFAEKYHAYTLPRGENIENSRSLDLVDMVLLIKEGRLHREKTINALNKTFQRRKTHPLGMKVGQPPISWVRPFSAQAAECGLTEDLSQAYEVLASFIGTLHQPIAQ